MMAHTLIPEGRIEFGRINLLIGGDLTETFEAGACRRSLHRPVARRHGPDAHRGEAPLCACADIALRFEFKARAAQHEAAW